MLVLLVDEWLGTTRLYKAVEKNGLAIDCRPPQKQQGKSKSLDEPAIVKWMSAGESRSTTWRSTAKRRSSVWT